VNAWKGSHTSKEKGSTALDDRPKKLGIIDILLY
jgi:hypothetical protein